MKKPEFSCKYATSKVESVSEKYLQTIYQIMLPCSLLTIYIRSVTNNNAAKLTVSNVS